jgi:hypothetical protein
MTGSKQRDAEQSATRDPRRPNPRERQPRQAAQAQGRSRPPRATRACVIGRECDAHYSYLIQPHD